MTKEEAKELRDEAVRQAMRLAEQSERVLEKAQALRLAFLSKLSPEDLLEELLATIHGDGGHYSDEHGLAKAVLDAETKWLEKEQS